MADEYHLHLPCSAMLCEVAQATCRPTDDNGIAVRKSGQAGQDSKHSVAVGVL